MKFEGLFKSETIADVSLLRPEHWLTQQAAAVGGIVYISVPECGIDGNAKVLAIEACPPIAANPGSGFQIVTGTFHHQAAKTLDIAVEGESKPIGTTPNHPIWSVDRQAFVRADSLTVGERLQTLNGTAVITSITARGPPEPVYNLEVQVKHTYYVADTGVLVHNGKNDCGVGDVVNYRPSSSPLENHHGLLDVWAKNNIKNYVSRGAKTPTVALTKAQHAATKKVYRDWLFEKTGKRVGGKVNWSKISPQEMQDLTYRMFRAADTPQAAIREYFSALNKYIYRGN